MSNDCLLTPDWPFQWTHSCICSFDLNKIAQASGDKSMRKQSAQLQKAAMDALAEVCLASLPIFVATDGKTACIQLIFLHLHCQNCFALSSVPCQQNFISRHCLSCSMLCITHSARVTGHINVCSACTSIGANTSDGAFSCSWTSMPERRMMSSCRRLMQRQSRLLAMLCPP